MTTRTRTVGDRFISEANLSRKDENYIYSRLRSTRVGPCLIRLRLTRRMRQLLRPVTCPRCGEKVGGA